MLRIRLTRVGKKKQPAYRIVVADSRSPRDGAFLKIIGHYDPLTDPATLVIKEEQAIHWLQKGAQPSEAAAKLLTRAGVMERAGKQPFVYKIKPAAGKADAKAPATEAKAPATEAKAPAAEKKAPAAEKKAPAAEAEAPAAEAEAPAAQAAPKASATKGKRKQEPEPTE